MPTLTITTYQASGIGREEPTDFPIGTDTFSTNETNLKASIIHYIVDGLIMDDDDIEVYMDSLTLGADGSYYKEDDQVLIGYSLK